MDIMASRAKVGKFKIQMAGPHGGWGDRKVSVDGGGYEAELFPTARAATREIQDMPKRMRAGHRVVPAIEPSQHDFY